MKGLQPKLLEIKAKRKYCNEDESLQAITIFETYYGYFQDIFLLFLSLNDVCLWEKERESKRERTREMDRKPERKCSHVWRCRFTLCTLVNVESLIFLTAFFLLKMKTKSVVETFRWLDIHIEKDLKQMKNRKNKQQIKMNKNMSALAKKKGFINS